MTGIDDQFDRFSCRVIIIVPVPVTTAKLENLKIRICPTGVYPGLIVLPRLFM